MNDKLREILIKLVENVTLSPNDNAMNKAISDIQQIHKEEMVKVLEGLKCTNVECKDAKVLAGLKSAIKELNQRIDAKIKELKQKEE